MKVFISSVRRGLEAERDYLPGLVTANGHRPMRFEDFGAQDMSSRGACLGGVNEADIYLLLLGTHYGAEMEDSLISATEEEFNAASSRGIPIYVFKKANAEPDEAQQQFMSRIGNYVEGRFWVEFNDNGSLGVEVTRALQEHRAPAPPFMQMALTSSIAVTWRRDTASVPPPREGFAILETKVTPIEMTSLRPVASLGELATTLAGEARQQGFFGHGDALNIGADADHAWVVRDQPNQQRGGFNERSTDPYAGIYISRAGAVGIFQALPTDMFGTLIDETDLTQRIAVLLRHIVPYLPSSAHIALAAALDPSEGVTEGDPNSIGNRREGRGMRFGHSGALQAPPVDQIPTGTLASHVHDVARDLSTRLMQFIREA